MLLFCRKIIEDRLKYNFTFKETAKNMRLKNRNNEKLNEIIIDDETLIYAENFKIVGVKDISEEVIKENNNNLYLEDEDDIYDDESEIDEWILEIQVEPIEENKALDEFVLTPIKNIVKRVNDYEKIISNPDYEYYNPIFTGLTKGSIYEFILDLDNIE